MKAQLRYTGAWNSLYDVNLYEVPVSFVFPSLAFYFRLASFRVYFNGTKTLFITFLFTLAEDAGGHLKLQTF